MNTEAQNPETPVAREEKASEPFQGNPAQVGEDVNYTVVLLERERRQLVGVLDSRNKHFLVLPGAEMPIAGVAKYCKYDNVQHDTRPTIYHKQADAQSDRVLMTRAIKSTGSKEYIVTLLPYLVKH